MPRLPTVAFVGAPNVGKSTLFNRIVERPRHARATAWEGPSQRAIVCDEPGTTRDRLYGRVEWEGTALRVIDTAGLFEGSSLASDQPAEALAMLELRQCAERQSELALREASALVFVVDVTLGVTAVDEMIAERLRCLGKPVLLAVNKVDSVDRLALVAEFWELRLGEPMPISAVHGTGTGDLLSTAVAACARAAADAPPPLDPAAGDAEAPLLRPLHVALVGRPNAGKSSLLNRLLGAERTAVSPTAGTTRDSVSAELLWRQQTLVLVDTAGLRKRATERGGTDADGRAQSAAARCVRDATVALCLFDAELGMTQHDISVLQSCIDEGRSVVLCANKWDAASAAGQRWGEVEAQLRRSLPNLEHVPILPISAATGEGLDRALSKAVEVAKGRAGRVPTAELNEAIAHAIARQPPPRGCSVRHAIQADAEVPTFVLFTRGPPTPSSYLRYLERCIREQIAFEGTPVRLMCKTDSGARARGAVRAAWAGGGGRGTPSVSQERHGRRGPRLGGPGGAGRGSELPSRRKC